MPIELINLSKSFDGREVFTNLRHTFPDGSVTCIVGPSGCGKTTLLRILLGLTVPDTGEIYGLPSGRTSVVFQEDRLIGHLSASANVRIVLQPGTPAAKAENALRAVGLGDALHQPVRELSGGMKRRVALVRALLADSNLVLMDEPFKGLDTDTRADVIRFVRPLLAGRTVIIVTHDPEEPALLGADLFTMR